MGSGEIVFGSQLSPESVREFVKVKRLLQPPTLIYPTSNPPTTSSGSGVLEILPDIGSSLVRGKGQPAGGIAKS